MELKPCADRSPLPHKVNLFDLHMKYAGVVPVDETAGSIEGVASRLPITA